MIRQQQLRHEFVTNVPDKLEHGVLYVSMEYATVVHSCCCGCGAEVVTPLTPTDWKMTFDGETISLWPSIGNWNEKCRSHYIIEGNRVIGAHYWSDRQISAEIQRDAAAKKTFYAARNEDTKIDTHPPAVEVQTAEPGLWRRMWNRMSFFVLNWSRRGGG